MANLQPLYKEIERRRLLCNLVDQVIKKHFCKRPGSSVKRGIVHEIVAIKLKLTLNMYLRALVNSRMEHLGFRRRILHGNRLFGQVALRAFR